VIYFSSSAVYSNDLRHPTLGGDVTAMKFSFEESRGHSLEPFDDYGLTKRHGEHMAMAAQRCGVNVSILRPFSGYGTDQSTDFPFGAFINRAIRGEDPFTIWGDAEQARDFIHVDDIVEAALTINLAQVREPVNVCTGVATTMLRLAETVIRARDVFSRYSPKIQVDETAPMGVTYRVGDPTSLHRWYTPRVTIEQGVHRAIEELHRG
jgi:UDP-glucose 4-epimerase